jgi:hypothetical protein
MSASIVKALSKRLKMKMEKMNEYMRNLLVLAGALALGYTAGSSRPVKAATGDIAFQLVDVKETSSLLVYQPSSKTVYVYRGATAGSSSLQCSFKYVLEAPGGVIQRVPCPVQSTFP